MSFIYGIDGGISFCGYSIFNDKGQLVLAGRVSTPSSIRTLSFNQKLFKITTKFKSLFDQYPPSVIVCEKPRMAVMFQGKAMEPHNLYKNTFGLRSHHCPVGQAWPRSFNDKYQ